MIGKTHEMHTLRQASLAQQVGPGLHRGIIKSYDIWGEWGDEGGAPRGPSATNPPGRPQDAPPMSRTTSVFEGEIK